MAPSIASAAQQGSYQLGRFAMDNEGEIRRLNAQVDLFWEEEREFYEVLGFRDGMSVLDCGCGPGHVLARLLERYPGLEVCGVEPDAELAGVARARLASIGAQRSVLEESVEATSLPDGSFDFVLCRLLLEHLPDPARAVREIHRVLKLGGTAVFVDNDFEFHERTWPETSGLSVLYDGYRRARRAEGGNPCIGRQLPLLLDRAGFRAIKFRALAAHSGINGDRAFLAAEGAGIPARLVQAGFLEPSAFTRVAQEWRAMLQAPEHAIMRVLFAASGQKLAASPPAFEAPARCAPERLPDPQPALRRQPDDEGSVREFIRNTLASEMEVAPDTLTDHDSLLHLNVDSLAAVGLCNRFQSEWGIELPVAEVLSGKSLLELAACVRALAADRPDGASNRPIVAQPRLDANREAAAQAVAPGQEARPE